MTRLDIRACKQVGEGFVGGVVHLEVPDRTSDAKLLGRHDDWPVYEVEGKLYELVVDNFISAPISLRNCLNEGKYPGLTRELRKRLEERLYRGDDSNLDLTDDPIGRAMQSEVDIGMISLNGAFALRTRGPGVKLGYRHEEEFVSVGGLAATYTHAKRLIPRDVVAELDGDRDHLFDGRIGEIQAAGDTAAYDYALWAFGHSLLAGASSVPTSRLDVECVSAFHGLRKALYVRDGVDPFWMKTQGSITRAFAPAPADDLVAPVVAVLDQWMHHPELGKRPEAKLIALQARGFPRLRETTDDLEDIHELAGVKL